MMCLTIDKVAFQDIPGVEMAADIAGQKSKEAAEMIHITKREIVEDVNIFINNMQCVDSTTSGSI